MAQTSLQLGLRRPWWMGGFMPALRVWAKAGGRVDESRLSSWLAGKLTYTFNGKPLTGDVVQVGRSTRVYIVGEQAPELFPPVPRR